MYKALFMPGEEIFEAMLNAPERKTRVEEALNQNGGKNARFSAVIQGRQESADKEKRQQESVSGLIDMFGRDKVQIDE